MPVCHYCHKNNLFANVNVCQVKEDIAKRGFRGKSHRICGKCLLKYQDKYMIQLTIKKIYWSKSSIH